MLHIFEMETTPQRQSADAQALARRAFAYLFGEAAPLVCRSASGKPYFDGSSYELSITHTGGAALCAIADAPVGLDAEAPRPVRPRLMERCLAPEELAVCRAAPDAAAVFLRFWTLKEAYGKYTGRGVIGFPNQWRFTLDGPAAYLAGSDLWFQTLTAGALTISVCCAAPQTPVLHPAFCAEK